MCGNIYLVKCGMTLIIHAEIKLIQVSKKGSD